MTKRCVARAIYRRIERTNQAVNVKFTNLNLEHTIFRENRTVYFTVE